jgi:thiamine biosynthesis lipoprotein
MTRKINRRRFIRIAAATASFGAARLLASPSFAAGEPVPTIWRGLALGNLASIEILHPDPARAAALLETARVEIERLESILSLYRPDSALSVLNRGGILRDPPLDLVRVLGEARRFGEITAGAFDVTVQPLWKVYADHFSVANCDPAGPSPASVRRAAARVDFHALEIEPDAVGLRRPEMGITLNGIAQGYITDRIAELFRNEGLDHVLVDLGEIRAVGPRALGEPWRIGIENPSRADSFLTELPLQDMALATSGSYGFRFDATGNFHHIFDPKSGSCPHRYASVSILAPDATTADALATACNLLPPDAISAALKAAGAHRALVLEAGGAMHWIDA